MSDELKKEEVDLGDEILGLPDSGIVDDYDDDEVIVGDERETEQAAATDEQPETPEPEAVEPEKKTPTVEELMADLERAEKRVKDNQNNWQEEHQARLALEKRLAELEAAKPSTPSDDKSDKSELDEDSFFDDPVAAIRKIREEQRKLQEEQAAAMQAEIQRLREEQWRKDMARQEAEMRAQHEDYDAVVTEFLTPQMKEDSTLQAEWQRRGGTASAAYELGRVLKERAEIRENPDAYRERLREELLKEIQGDKPKIGKTLSGSPSGRGRVAEPANDDLLSVLDY